MGEEGTDEFLVEDVETIIKGALQSVLSDTTWDPAKIGTWANMVEEAVLKGLQGLGRGFKYVATVVLMQKNGAGLHTAAGAFWDTKKDGMCKVPWENTTMHCIVTVFGLAIGPSPQVQIS